MSICSFPFESISFTCIHPVPPHLKVHVHGKGAIADMYRALLGSFDPTGEKGGIGFKFTKCIPVPHKPNFAIYEEIGTFFYNFMNCLLSNSVLTFSKFFMQEQF